MKLNKHIVWLVPGFAADTEDDTCNPYLHVLLKELEVQFPNIKITIIAFQYPFTSESYEWGRSTVFPMNGENRKGLFRFSLWRKAFLKFKKINSKNKVDLIHSFWFSECMVLGHVLSKRFKTPHFNTLMGQDVLNTNKYLKKYFYKSVITTALSKRMAEIFRTNTSCYPIAIIPMGVEEIKTEKDFEKKYDIIGVGSFIPLKRYDMFLRIVSKLKIKFPEIKIALAGDGTEMNSLKKLARDLNITENIYFAGKLKRKQVLDLMLDGKLFVHTSEHEGMGYVFAEAIHCGLPIVSFSVGCAEESSSWKIAKSENEMTDFVSQILNDELQIKHEINYPVSKTAKAYVELYEQFSKSNL